MAATKRAARQKAVRESAQSAVAVEEPSGKGVPEASPSGAIPDAFPGDMKEPAIEEVDQSKEVFDFTVADNTDQSPSPKKVKKEPAEEAEEAETEEVEAEEKDTTGDTAEETDAGEEAKFEIDTDLSVRVKEWGLKDSDVERFESADELDMFLNRLDLQAGFKAKTPAPKQEVKPAEAPKPLADPAEFTMDLELDPDETDPAVLKMAEAMKKSTAHLQQQNKELRDHLASMNQAAKAQADAEVAQEWDEGINQLDEEFRVLLGGGVPSNSLDVNSQEYKLQTQLLEDVQVIWEHRVRKGLPVKGMLAEFQRRCVKLVFEKEIKVKAQEVKNEKKAKRHSQKIRRPVGQRKGGPVQNASEAAEDAIKDHAMFKGISDEPDDVLAPMGL